MALIALLMANKLSLWIYEIQRLFNVSGHGGLSISSAGSDSGSCDSKSTKVESMLVMSGGEGYIDFRIGIHNTLLTSLPYPDKLIYFALFCYD